MRSKVILVGTSVILSAGTSLIIACRDAPTTLERNRRDNVRVSSAASAARERIHQRNAHDWVGVAHNRVLDDWRQEMRKPGVLTHNLCSYVVDFIVRDERLPLGKQTALPVRRQAVAAAAKASKLCQATANRSQASALAAYGENAARRARQSDALASLQSEIETSIDVAQSSFDLAARLNSVLDAAAALDETEQTVVSATVSVAQNSYEYWEPQYPVVVQEVETEYGTCAADRRAAGYTMEAARDACLSGEYALSSFRGWSPNSFLGPTRFSAGKVSLLCGPGLGAGFKHVAKNDARGAFAGGFAGALGGGAGIVAGALIGGGSASIWAAGENAWSTYWCMMK